MTEHPPDDPDSPGLQGKLVAGKYRVIRLVGTGGMGTVWEGVHEGLGQKVAIKFIRHQFANAADARQRFEIEARAAAKLQSKHAVQVFDYGVTDDGDGLPYIVMEYLVGDSLSDALIRRGPLPAAEVAKLIGQASRALAKAHGAGIVHRDLKPDNIFLSVPEETSVELPYIVKLVDFGIAKMFDEPLIAQGKANPMGGPTQEGAVIGTPNFMAPEQLTIGGAPTPLTDLWSLGACTFAAMTARIPFEGEILGDIVLKVCVAPLPIPSKLNPNVPPGFDAWFARACNRDPNKRFQTAAELAESLANVCGIGKVRVATRNEDQVQYSLKRGDADAQALADELDDMPKSMSPRAALGMGLVLGVTMMIGVLGVIAWRDKQREELLNAAATSSVTSSAAPTISQSAPPVVSAAPSASASSVPSAKPTHSHHSAHSVPSATPASATSSTTEQPRPENEF